MFKEVSQANSKYALTLESSNELKQMNEKVVEDITSKKL